MGALGRMMRGSFLSLSAGLAAAPRDTQPRTMRRSGSSDVIAICDLRLRFLRQGCCAETIVGNAVD